MIMKALRQIIACAMTTIAATGMWAATQGTTHDHPISDELTKKYLTEYMGITNYSDNNWGFIQRNSTVTAPTATTAGDVLFIQVNDYWKGSNWDATPNLYNQIKYGVKSIDKVTQSSQIGSGMLYHYDATTNRFFFAIRTSDFYTGSGEWKKISGYNSRYYLSESYKMPLRWYNEFSATTDTKSAGWDVLDPAYDALKDGDFMPVPHSCSNSLEKNHFTTLYSKDITDQTYTISAMLYVPTGANATTNQKNGSFSTSNIPQVFFYINKLTGERVKNTVAGADCDYASLLNWKTSFDLAKEKHPNFVTWKSGTAGVKEVSKIYRKIEGEDGFTLVKEGLVDLKTWTDNTLPNPGKEGYSVEYYVVTEAITCDAQGNLTYHNVGTAATNHITVNIPGSEQFFELAIANKFNSKFTPAKNQINKSYNLITNNVTPAPTEFTPALKDIKVNDKFELVRTDETTGAKAVKTVVITAKNGTKWTYTVDGKSTTSSISDIQTLLDIVSKYNDQVNSIPGEKYDSKYQLVYTSGNDVLHSNIVTSQGMRTDVITETLYRSGTPDPVNNAQQELYTSNVYFKPIYSNDVAHYHIWMNGEEPVIRVGQSGTTFTLVGKDENGNFNIPMGEIKPEEEGYYKGYLKVRVNAALDKKAHLNEIGEIAKEDKFTANDLFYTVEVVTTGENSYGNRDQSDIYQGVSSELVYNITNSNFYAGEGSVQGYYRAEFDWTKVNRIDDEDDYINQDPDYFTVYRKMDGEDSYSPMTGFYVGHEGIEYNYHTGEYEEPGFQLYDQTTDGSAYKFTPELINKLNEEQALGFKFIDIFENKSISTSTFPAMYYVKAHYDSYFNDEVKKVKNIGHAMSISDKDMRNFMEKNSDPTYAYQVIPTAVEDVNVDSEVVKVTYYNLMGVEVANPAAGEIVVAKKSYANGTTASKVIKM